MYGKAKLNMVKSCKTKQHEIFKGTENVNDFTFFPGIKMLSLELSLITSDFILNMVYGIKMNAPSLAT